MRIMCVVIRIGVVAPAGVHDLSGSQNGAATCAFTIGFGGSRGTGRQLLAHILGKGNATTRTGIALRAAKAIKPLSILAILLMLLLRFKE